MRSLNNHNVVRYRQELLRHALVLGAVVALIWLFEGVDYLILSGQLDQLGIQPRTWIGLRNIPASPFLHGGFGHLLANTLPFIVLGWLVMLRRTSDFFFVSIVAMMVSGLGIWIFGASNSIHIGLSGVIFGYLGFLLLRGYLERSFSAILLALVAIVFYGGMLWGLLPLQPGVSWLGHLFGFAGGCLAAYALTSGRRSAG